MRHLKNRNKLGVKTSHRIAMVRNLVTQLLQYKQIVTTLARAKNIRTPVDRMIILAKKNNLSSQKRIFSFVKNKAAVKMLQRDSCNILDIIHFHTTISHHTQSIFSSSSRTLHIYVQNFYTKISCLFYKIFSRNLCCIRSTFSRAFKTMHACTRPTNYIKEKRSFSR